MLCACSGEQFKFEEPPPPQSPESLATRDFSASGHSSRTTGDWESKLEDAQVDEAESTLKEALSLNYEEARALLGRLEYQKGNFDAALQVYQGIDIRILLPRMTKAIMERTRKQRKPRPKGKNLMPGVMSLHSVSLLLEAILLKTKSLEELGRFKEAAKECKRVLDVVESALPNGMPHGIGEDCKMQETFHKALELLPKLWIQAGFLDESISAYRRALIKPWNLHPQRLASVQKDLAALLLYGGVESILPPHFQLGGLNTPKTNTEEAILLLFILMKKVLNNEIEWDAEISDHLTFALSVCGQFESLANHVEQALPGIYNRCERWYFLSLCYSAAGQNDVALNLLKKVFGSSEISEANSNIKPHLPSFLLGAKLCSLDPKDAHDGIKFARRVMDLEINQNEHFIYQAHKFLGVCYSNAARISISDSERLCFNEQSLNSLKHAVLSGKEDPESILSLGGSLVKGWKLLALTVSAEQRFEDAETIVDLALDESGRIDQLELLRLKAVLQIAQEQPKHAIESYRILLALVQGQREQTQNFDSEFLQGRRLEIEAWNDLAKIYTKLESWPDAEICLGKAKCIEFYSSRTWHQTGMLFEAREMHKEALVAFTVALSIEPEFVPSIVSTAEVLMKMGSKSLPIARSFLMNALRLEPTNHEAWWNLGLVSKMEGLMHQAADFFQAAHELEMSAPVQSFV
ncbi:hypothetical protein C3L33_10851, partial [Rhododendron williamsianum]